MATNNIRSTGSTIAKIYKTSSTSVPAEVDKMYITNSSGVATLVYDTEVVNPPSDEPLTQATMPSMAQAWSLAATPTVTTSVTSTISGGTLFTPNTVNFKVLGTKQLVDSETTGYWRAEYMADKGSAGTTDPYFLPSYGVRFTSTAATIEVKLQQRPEIDAAAGGSFYKRIPIRIKVNGKWTSEYPIYLGNPTPDDSYPNNTGESGYDDLTTPDSFKAGVKVHAKIAFGSAATRTVEIFSMVEFGGIVGPSANSITAPAAAPTHTAVVLGDSLNGAEKHGTGNWSLSGPAGSSGISGHRATYTQLSAIWGYVCQSLGYDNVVNSGSGSTGYLDVGDTTYYKSDARIEDDVIAHNPGLVMVGTCFNDVKSDGSNIDDVEVAANYTINKIKTALPDAIIVMFGNPKAPVIPEYLADAVITPYNTMLRGVASDRQVWFFNPYDGKLYNKSGTLVYTDSNGGLMNGNGAYVSSDKTHPTQEGAMVFGKKISEFLRLAHPVS